MKGLGQALLEEVMVAGSADGSLSTPDDVRAMFEQGQGLRGWGWVGLGWVELGGRGEGEGGGQVGWEGGTVWRER